MASPPFIISVQQSWADGSRAPERSTALVNTATTILELKRMVCGEGLTAAEATLKTVIISGRVASDHALVASSCPKDTMKLFLVHRTRPWDPMEPSEDDSSTATARSVTGENSAQQKTTHPPERGSKEEEPKESPKSSRKKKKTKKKPKKKARKKPRTRKNNKSRDLRRNEKKAETKGGGSRLVRSKGVAVGGADERSCLKDALLAILPAEEREDANAKLSAAMEVVPADRDACPRDMKLALAEAGHVLERASQDYNHKKNHPTSLLILQDRESKLVLHIRLIDAADRENPIQHFVAWDGETIIDCPYSVRINNGTDRTCPKKSQEAFGKLFGRWYESWQITNVWRLRAK